MNYAEEMKKYASMPCEIVDPSQIVVGDVIRFFNPLALADAIGRVIRIDEPDVEGLPITFTFEQTTAGLQFVRLKPRASEAAPAGELVRRVTINE